MGRAVWEAADAGNAAEVARLVDGGAPVDWANEDEVLTRFRKRMPASTRGALQAAFVPQLPDNLLFTARGHLLQAGCTALARACAKGFVEVAGVLLDRRADIEAKNSVSLLATQPAAPPIGVPGGIRSRAFALPASWRPLMTESWVRAASKRGRRWLPPAAVTRARKGASAVQFRKCTMCLDPQRGATALLMAVDQGSTGAVSFLLARDANLEAKDHVRQRHGAQLCGVAEAACHDRVPLRSWTSRRLGRASPLPQPRLCSIKEAVTQSSKCCCP